MAEWLRRGLQILARRFDSGSGLQRGIRQRPWTSGNCLFSGDFSAVLTALVRKRPPRSGPFDGRFDRTSEDRNAEIPSWQPERGRNPGLRPNRSSEPSRRTSHSSCPTAIASISEGTLAAFSSFLLASGTTSKRTLPGVAASIHRTATLSFKAAAMVCRFPPTAPGITPSQIAIRKSDCSIMTFPAIAARSEASAEKARAAMSSAGLSRVATNRAATCSSGSASSKRVAPLASVSTPAA